MQQEIDLWHKKNKSIKFNYEEYENFLIEDNDVVINLIININGELVSNLIGNDYIA